MHRISRFSCYAVATLALMLIATTTAYANDRIQQNRAALDAYFADRVATLAEASRIQVESVDAWPEQRERYRQQLAESLGLHPMPERTPLNPVITGTVEHDDFIVEKLHFQAQPGLYVTGNLYLPRDLDEPAPTILYLCGHANRIRNGVSLGNKTAYQHHPAWLAQHGYVALVVDTIQLGEIQGLHHGTHREGMWWWNSRGYSPAGVEAFNAMRALDYLETRPEVDPARFGVTGRSGGGIGTLFLAALDERVAVAAPVAGITDIHNHVVDHLTPSHCDCNYFPNIYQFDYARIVSLIAPRPLLIANTDRDPIFPLDGVQRIHAEVADLYRQLNATEDVGLAVVVGGHADTQPLRVPVFAWFNQHLKSDTDPIRRPAEQFIDEAELRVFDDLPEDETVTRIHDTFVPAAQVNPPADAAAWREQRDEFKTALNDRVFRGWPQTLPDLDAERAFQVTREGVTLEAWDFTVEAGVTLRLHLAYAPDTEVERIVLSVVDDASWAHVASGVYAVFADHMPSYPEVAPDREAFNIGRQYLRAGVAFAVLAPRGVGPNQWAQPGSATERHLRRSFPIIGQSLDGQRVLDVRRALEGLHAHPSTRDLPVTLTADGQMAGVALYAAVMGGPVDRLQLNNLPTSHQQGPELLHVLRFMDMPQALAIALEHTDITLTTDHPDAWRYARRVADLLERSAALTIE